jgi:hypothetical protein
VHSGNLVPAIITRPHSVALYQPNSGNWLVCEMA